MMYENYIINKNTNMPNIVVVPIGVCCDVVSPSCCVRVPIFSV